MVAAAAALVVAFLAPQVAKADWFDDIVNFVSAPIVTLFGGGEDNGIETLAVENADTVVDPDTTNDWTKYTRPGGSPSTQNVGRIWTDKSVFDKNYTFSGSEDLAGKSIQKGDSDFLVGLSALSSMSNLKETTTTTTPLDIVLVVDTSGSMDNGEGDDMGYAYTEAYPRGNYGTYYVQDEGEWHELDYSRSRGWYYNAGSWIDPDYRVFTPKTSADDGDPTHTQFYSRERVNKMEALQRAANTFVDSVAALNDSIADPNDQHRISLVKFASNESNSVGDDTYDDREYNYRPNYSQVVSDLQAYTSNTADSLKNTINRLEGAGATRADYGLHQAQRVLNGDGTLAGAREGAQKVVIFFTDGEPTTYQNFNNEVASSAVNYARSMKQDGTLVYSIGVVQGADPSDDPTSNGTSNINKFLHAVSSNYKNATYEDGQFGWNWSFGDRTTGAQGEPNPDYYFAATDADELDQVFEDITSSITENASSGSPIVDNSTEGNTNPGTLTFTDQLGAYMQVTGTGAGDDKIQLAYGDTIYTSDSKTTSGNTDTYHFSGEVEGNAVYGAANLADLVVTVERSNDPAVGDKVTVQLPASLLPLRNYGVDTDNHTMTVAEAYPVRLFYGVSLKQDAVNAIASGTGDVYDNIMTTNKSADGGSAEFLTNQWTKGSATGDTTATFTPNSDNKFYYYTSNTPLYVDEDCTQRATSSNIDNYNTLYYSEPYWVLDDEDTGAAHQVTTGIAINRTGKDWNSIEYESGQAYIPVHTQRLDRPATLNSGKDDNNTGTADSVLTPQWEGTGVSQRLGNNGKVTIPLPGQLEIKKNVDWGNASDETKKRQNNFEFTVNFNGEETLAGDYIYAVYGQGEEPVRTGTVTDGGTITLEGNQRAIISGLPDGTTFTVTEMDANENGFTTTDQGGTGNTDLNDGVVSGTILGGGQQSVAFQNNYKADEALTVDAVTYLQVKKDLQGRDWRADDEFTFDVQSVDMGSGVAEPESSSVTITEATKDQAVSFGNIKFTSTGTFRYIVTEDNEDQIVGIDYSSASYRLEITIGDAGNGNLKVDSYRLERLQDDEGSMEPGQTEQVQNNTVTFVNTYTPDAAPVNIDGIKNYTDNSGDNPTVNNKFQFQMEALGGYVTGTGSRDDLTISADDTPKPVKNTQGNVTTIGNEGGEFHMPTISYTGDHVGNTYVYKITEVKGSEEGMTYDETSYEVEVTVTEEPEPTGEEGQAHIEASVNKTPKDLTFTNTYDPGDVTLGDNGAALIEGTKTLNGRAMQQGETFYFQLTALSDNAKTVLPEAKTVAVTDPNSMSFDFGKMTFTKVGQYTFQVNEVANEAGDETTDGNGMRFDTNIATVTVDVTLNKDAGKLEATVSYVNDSHSDVNDRAQFTNVYEASMNYGASGAGGIKVTKTMVNRAMAEGDFDFTLTGADSHEQVNEEFSNPNAGPNQTVEMPQLQNLTFDQNDAGKTFTFTVDEVEPAEADKLVGVSYDQSEYLVAITVHDKHNGTMYTETTVTRTKNFNGNSVSEVVVNAANSDTDEAPTFGFTNTYEPTGATLDGASALQVTKTVEGAPSPDGVEYSFTLTAQNTAEGPVANIGGLTDGKLTVHTTGVINLDAKDNTDDDSQTVSFGALTFSKPGTYTFSVVEDAPATDDGWTYDTAAKTVKVVVSDRNEAGQYDGALHISSVTGSPVEITNSYKAGSVVVGGDGAQQQITVQKTVTGANSTADFQFKIEPVDVDDLKWKNVEAVDEDFDAMTSITDDFSAGDSKTATFAGIKFNATGEYKFKITEVGATEFNGGTTAERAGWTYDEHEAIVTVTVTDDNFDGQLDATVTYDNGTQAAEFTNKYEAGSTPLIGSESFKGTKIIEGRNGIDEETFGFTLEKGEATNGGNWDAVTFQPTNGDASAFDTATATATMHKDSGSADFWFDGTFTFAKAGTYTFNVTETSHNGRSLPEDGTNGMTYDRHIGTVTVTVTDDGQGNLHATAKAGDIAEGDTENDLTFENAYAPEPARWGLAESELLGGHKYINDTTGNTYTLEAGQFSFTLRAQAAGNPMPEGWDNNTDDQGRGKMTVTNGTGNATDVSIYDFGTIEFTHDDMVGATEVEGQPGVFTKTFQYNIFETGTMPAGISRDNTAYTVTFTVTEDHNTGKISVAKPTAVKIVNGGSGEGTTGDSVDVTELDFTNTYNPTTIEGHQNIFKTLDGRNWQQGDIFTFNVSMTATQADGSEWPAGAPLPSVKASDGYTFSEIETNDAGNGFDYTVTINPSSQTGNTYRFDTGTITYEREGVYTWTISEQKSTVEGVTSDGTEYTIKVTVTDENGVLDRKVELIGGSYNQHEGDQTLDFTNKYTTTGTLDSTGDEAIRVTKVFTGRVNDEWLDTDSFKAMLTAEDSLVDGQTMPAENVPMPDGRTGGVATVDLTKDNHENVAFGNITYTRPGTYNYTLTEVQENTLAGVNYSRAAFNVVVTATDNGDGTMTVTSEINQVKTDDGDTFSPLAEVDGTATFTNTYRANSATLDGAANLTVTKNLEGRAWFDTDDWTFTLSPKDDATKKAVNDDKTVIMSLPTQLTITGNTPGHTASFGNITFKEAGTYTFTVTEEGFVEGVTNDAKPERTVVINVTDDASGNLVAEVDAAKSDNLTFTNKYDPSDVTIGGDANDGITVQKTLAGRSWNTGEEYSFTIAPAEGYEDAPMPTNDTITVGAPADGATNTATFGEMTFSHAGTYVYEISEQIPTTSDASMTYDEHAATVTVAVFEGGAGHAANELWAQVSYDNSMATNDADRNVTDAAAFTNTQEAEKPFELTGTKHLDGRDFQMGDSFTFNVTADEGAPLPENVDEDGNITINPTEGNDVTINFGTITFTKAGEYVYHIAEQAGDADGITYDTARRDIIVTVTDDGQGTLSADITTGADQLTWTNSWTFGGATFPSLNGTKTLTGAELTDGQFTFLVEAQNDAPMGSTLPANFNGDATQNEDGSWTAPVTLLNNIAYTESGEYVYLITEVNDGQPDITYDTTRYRVTVTVEADGTVEHKIEKSADGEVWEKADAIAFKNSHTTDGEAKLDGSANLSGSKILKGRDWTNDDSFTFILAAGDDDTKAAVEDGTVTLPGETAVVLQGAYSDGAQVPFSFGDITFTKAGTYIFTIREQQPSDDGFVGVTDGMTYDSHERIITVVVSRNDDEGRLAAEVINTEGDSTWTNIYKKDELEPGTLDGKDNLKITKVLEGRDWKDGDNFTFKLVPGDEATRAAVEVGDVVLPENASGLVIDANTADHQAAFGDIIFKKEGNYTFIITEDAQPMIPGVTYDTAERKIEVSVMDDLKGGLEVHATATKSLTFTNVYDAEKTDEVPLSGTKLISNRDFIEGDSFTFHVSTSGAPLPGGVDPVTGNVTITPSEGNSAEIGFGSIVFDEPGDYTYAISEVAGDNASITYDGSVKMVTIHVVDMGNGKLEATIDEASDNLIWTNVYNVQPTDPSDPTDGTITVIKKLDGRELADGEFTFVMKPAEDYGDAVSPAEGITTTNDADGSVYFDQEGQTGFVFSKAGEYDFTISEVVPDDADPNMTYDRTVYTVRASVVDNNSGTLSVTWQLLDVDGKPVMDNPTITFTNVYDEPDTPPVIPSDPDPSDPSKPDIDVDKRLDGRDMVAGEFSFEIEATGDNADKVTPGRLTGTNDAGGGVSFSGDGFTFSEAGDYEFTVSEVLPPDDDPDAPGVQHDGVTYDEATYTITAKVTEVDGKLVVEWDLGAAAAGITFHNTYEPSEVAKVTIGATKVLIGRDLATGEFTFELVDAQGNVVATATNGADGSVYFPTLEFDKAGTYEYTIREVVGSLTGVTYDTTVHTVTITVVDNGDGTLTATVTYDGGSGSAPVFTNTYVEPDKPGKPGKPEEPSEPERPDTPKIPDAGDHTNVALPAFLAVGGAALIACACLLRLRKSR